MTPCAIRLPRRRRRARHVAFVLLACVLPMRDVRCQGSRAQHAQAERVVETVKQLERENRPHEALELLDLGLDTLDALDPRMRAFVLFHRADLRRRLLDLAGAHEDLDAADALTANTRGSGLVRANIAGQRGMLALDEGLLDIAADAFGVERALVEDERAQLPDAPIEWFTANGHLAQLWSARQEFETLVAQIDAWLADELYASPADAARALSADRLRLAQAFGLSELGERDATLATRARALLVETIPRLPDQYRRQALLLLAELSLRDGDLDAARDALASAALLLDAAASDEGGSGLERDRPLLLALSARADRLAGSDLVGHAARLDEQLLRFAEAWEARPQRAGGYGPLQYATTLTLLDERIELRFALAPDGDADEDACAAALQDVLRLRGVSSLARTLAADVPDLAEVRDLLLEGDPRRALLVYVPTSWTTHLFVLDARGTHHLRLPREDVIEAVRSDLARSRASPRSPSALARRAALRGELGRLLLPDALIALASDWDAVSIEGLDLLGELPFERLPFGDAGELGLALAVDIVPSLPIACALARRARASASRPAEVCLLGVVHPSQAALVLSPDLPDLPLDAAFCEDVLAPVPPAARRVVLEGADREALFAVTSPVLQIVTHTVHDGRREAPVALVLAATGVRGAEAGAESDDGLLYPDEIDASRRLAAELVVVTACRSGFAPLRRGDPGSADLAGAFLAAGAEAVVVSPWPLELESVRRLSPPLHLALLEGASPAEAVRRARVALHAADPESDVELHVVGFGQRALFDDPSAAVREDGRDGEPADASPVASSASTELIGAAIVLLVAIAFVARRPRRTR